MLIFRAALMNLLLHFFIVKAVTINYYGLVLTTLKSDLFPEASFNSVHRGCCPPCICGLDLSWKNQILSGFLLFTLEIQSSPIQIQSEQCDQGLNLAKLAPQFSSLLCSKIIQPAIEGLLYRSLYSLRVQLTLHLIEKVKYCKPKLNLYYLINNYQTKYFSHALMVKK